ncbi:MAG: hypothetical protein ACKVJ4_00310 [Flavobacteriales bacterium]|jgi:hypothetical protein|tara:strand:+ start:45417 stop:46046 length:630 start_codon:yes stop_codon:yes gene_type:complete
MKKLFTLLFVISISTLSTFGQEIGADLVSRYVWRGTQFGDSAHIQPGISYTTGDLEIGAWGSFALSGNDGGSELDLYISYDLGFASLTLTNYTFPGDASASIIPDDFFGVEGYELSTGFELGPVGLNVGYFTETEDLYIETGFSLGNLDVAIGGGNEVYTLDGDFAVCNVSLGTSKEIKITEDYSLPIFGSFVYNPDTTDAFLVLGASF